MAADNQPSIGELIKRVLELEEQDERSELRIGEFEAQSELDRAGLAAANAQFDIDQLLITELQAQAVIDGSEIANLRIALHSARRIGAAMGIIMVAHKVTEEQAFAALRIASQHTHRKLRDIADEVLLTGLPPSPSPSG